jgi:hypothetical protein
MRAAPEPVKLQIANVGGFQAPKRAAAAPLKIPQKQIYSS